jgi:(4-alkanoyl-5-oxo-2,5-dihydrofuran-3-yl)methyl phosphate reductase
MQMLESNSGATHLVTGATGNIGTRVVKGLLRRGERTRVFVRDADKARKSFGDRVDVKVGDFADPASLSHAVDGADVVFLVTAGPDLAEKDNAATAAAKSAGARLVVKLSTGDVGLNVGTGPWHQEGEAAIRDSGIGFVFVQPSGFMDNFLKWAKSIKADGIVRCCAGDGRMPFIHSDDIAAVAIEAMTRPQYAGQSLSITGPEALSFADMTVKVGSAIGRELCFQPISEERERQQQIAWGTTEPLVEARLGIFRAMRAGQLAGSTKNVASILGRDPISFARWADQNAAAFR